MPITDEGYSYEFPEDVRKLITKPFLSVLRYEICKIENLEGFENWDEYNNESTAGWFTAFGVACMRTQNDELFKHSQSLEWFEHDIFAVKLTELMEEEKIFPVKLNAPDKSKMRKSYYHFALGKVKEYESQLKAKE